MPSVRLIRPTRAQLALLDRIAAGQPTTRLKANERTLLRRLIAADLVMVEAGQPARYWLSETGRLVRNGGQI